MSASRFIGRVGGLAVALGVGVAVFSAPGAAWADSGEDDTGGASPVRSAAGGSPAGDGGAVAGRAHRANPAARNGGAAEPAKADRGARAAAPTTRAGVTRVPAVSTSSGDRQAATAVQAPVAEASSTSPSAAVDVDPTPAGSAASSVASAVAVAIEPAAPEPAPASAAVSGFLSAADGGPADGAGTDPLVPAASPLAWALAAVARRDPSAAASIDGPVALATVGEQQTNNGVTADPTVEFVDGIIQGELNATSASGSTLTYTAGEGSNGGKLDIGTVPTLGGTDPQSFTILPYANWLDSGGAKGVETFTVRITEVTGFTQFITSIPLVGLLAEPIIGLLQRTPFLSTLLAPLIGGSLLATIDVDVSALAPGDTPLAFTYDVTSFDGTPISTNFFPASGIQAGETAPTVLNGPGLGSPGETDPYNLAGTFGSVPGVAVIREEGYNIVTWDPRGEFASGGVLQLDNPFYEGRDTSAIVSWAAENPLVELNGPDDPAVGMIGGSYGGGIQMVTAATDPRIDAIIPNGNWYSLMDSLYPAEVFKSAWSVLLLLDLVEAGARINEQIYEGVFTGLLGGFLSDTSQAVITSSGPTSLLNQLQAPTLLLQGTVDALFPLDQSVLNAETITANPFGTPVKMGWFCGGHGSCTSGTSEELLVQQNALFADTLAWLDTYVAGGGSAADAVPVFQWWDQNVDRYTSDLLPFQPGFNKPDPYTATSDGGTLGIIPIIGGSGPGTTGGFPISLIFPTEAGNAINVDLTPGTGEQIVGAPQLTFTYSGLGTSNAVYAQFVDNATGQIVGNNVTAVPVTLDGRERTVSIALNDIAYTVGTGDSLTLQITDWSSIFFNAGIGVVNISDIQIDLPLRAIPTTTVSYTVTQEVDAAAGGSEAVFGWQGLTTAGEPEQYLILGTTTNPSGGSGSAGLLYQGPITAEGGAGYVMVMPDQPGQTTASTTSYSADLLGGGQLRVVGTYTNASASNELGFVFTGTVDDVGDAASYVSMPFPTPTATWNTPHSTANGLVVGNYDSSTSGGDPAGAGRAYIYDAVTQTYLVPDMIYPGSVANTNYGIWWNGGTSYTIAGGFSNLPENNLLDPRVPLSDALLVDYDSATGEFSNWTSYRYTNPSTGFSGITHFEGISGVEEGSYTMAATALDEGAFVAGFVTVERNPDGSFGDFTWTTLDPGVGGINFADSVYGNAIVGISPTADAVNAYQAVITLS